MLKRIISAKQVEILKARNQFQEKRPEELTPEDIKRLVILLAKKEGLIK